MLLFQWTILSYIFLLIYYQIMIINPTKLFYTINNQKFRKICLRKQGNQYLIELAPIVDGAQEFLGSNQSVKKLAESLRFVLLDEFLLVGIPELVKERAQEFHPPRKVAVSPTKWSPALLHRRYFSHNSRKRADNSQTISSRLFVLRCGPHPREDQKVVRSERGQAKSTRFGRELRGLRKKGSSERSEGNMQNSAGERRRRSKA